MRGDGTHAASADSHIYNFSPVLGFEAELILKIDYVQ
jgi:hypothetical protein